MTYTRTYTASTYADPYKQCAQCGGWVTGALVDNDRLPPEGPLIVVPCEHQRGYRDVCPSWSPVDGCRCEPIDHPVPPADVIGDRCA